MDNIPAYLDYQSQLYRLNQLGIKNNGTKQDINFIKTVGYYKLKEFAQPFRVDQEEYSNVKFEDVVRRYYQDKNMRMQVLHAIESIEVAVNSEIANHLGKRYGAFGYLDFSKWCNKKEYSKYSLEKEQYFFKSQIKRTLKKATMPDLNISRNLDQDGFPTIWLMVNALMFGNTSRFIKLMAPKNVRAIAAEFDCTGKELNSWLGCLNLVRNICSHNEDLLDIKFKEKPIPPSEYKNCLVVHQGLYTDRIAIALFIIRHFMNTINFKYRFNDIAKSVYKAANNSENQLKKLGFTSKRAVDRLRV